VKAKNLAEFLLGIRFIDTASIYHHFYEARMRLRGADDFSIWIESALGKMELAGKIRAIDPFMHTLDDIRKHILEAVEAEVEKEMEFIP
jgi:hypothetical protein